jgi:hypothetical protein
MAEYIPGITAEADGNIGATRISRTGSEGKADSAKWQGDRRHGDLESPLP